MSQSTRGDGQYLASQVHRAYAGRLYKPATRKGVILCAGLSGTADSWYSTSLNALDTPNALVGAGFPTASPAVNATWGNSTMRTRITDLRTFMQSTTPRGWQFGSGKVHLLGSSMGSACVLNWAKNNPTLVQSIAITIGPPDMQAIHAADRGGLAASIAAAYGGSAPTDADNPADYAADLTGIPIKVWYSSNDTLILPAETEAFIAASGAESRNMGALGHAVDGTEVPEIASFFSAND